MNRIAIDGEYVAFFVVIEYAVAPEWARADDVSVCKDVSPLGIDDETRCLTGKSAVGIEGAGLCKMLDDSVSRYTHSQSLGPEGHLRSTQHS